MAKTHVLIPYTTSVACGQHGFTANALVREQVTCKHCKSTEHYKALPNASKKWAQERGLRK